MKLNTEFFKRESTWLNIAEAVGAVGVQLLVDLPTELSGPLWAYITLRLFMGVVQGVSRAANS